MVAIIIVLMLVSS